MKLNLKFIVFSVFTLIFAAFAPAIAKAEETNSFSVSPPNFDLSASPGDSVKNTIKLQNLSNKTVVYTVKAENFVAYGSGGQVNITEEESSYSISKWISFPVNQFTVEPQKTYLFDFTIQIPKNAEPGSHYGAVVFASSNTGLTSSSGASVVQEIGSLVLIRIPGEVKESASLISFQPLTNVFKEPRIQLNALVENTGAVHYKMQPQITIYDLFGNKVSSVEGTSNNVLPGSQRLFSTEFDFKNIGYYKAQLEMFYDNGTKEVKAETDFYSLNLAQSVPIGGGILGLLLFYVIFRRRINRAVKVMITGK